MLDDDLREEVTGQRMNFIVFNLGAYLIPEGVPIGMQILTEYNRFIIRISVSRFSSFDSLGLVKHASFCCQTFVCCRLSATKLIAYWTVK